MNLDLTNLIALQEADRELARLRAEIAELPKRVAAIEQKLAGARAQMEKAQSALKANDAARRKHEAEIQDRRQKISKYRDQMLEVKTNEQYRALTHEVEFAEKDIRSFEDKILEIMLDIDARQADIKAAERVLKEETVKIEKEKEQARAKTAEDEAQAAEWNQKRDALRAKIEESTLRQYDRVSKYRGTGLAEAVDHRCSGCQMMLRPQVYNDVRANERIVFCDSCQRVLYFNPEHQPAPQESFFKKRSHRFDNSRGWYYVPQYEDAGEVFIFFESGRESTRRVYDAHTGRKIGDTVLREGDFSRAFPEIYMNARRVHGEDDVEKIEEYGNEIPGTVLDILHSDLRAAQAETAHHSPVASH